MARNPVLPAVDPADTRAVLDGLHASFIAAQATNIGFPAATDLDFSPLARFLGFMTNNLGDPQVDGAYPIHTKAQEREAVDKIATLLRAPAADRWGYVTSGATEGTEHALWMARTRFPQSVVYYSQAAHPCVPAAIERLAMRSVVVRTDVRGEIDYDDLTYQIDLRRDQAVIIVANIGTAITEAVDDVRRITALLDDLAVTRRWIHADAALSGIPLALVDAGKRPGYDFADGADSIIVSGHKFIGSPVPYGVLVVRDSLRPDGSRHAIYTGSPNSTLSNSRSGLAALALWYTLREHGPHLQHRAEQCRALADHACRALQAIGVAAWRHPYAFTVVLPTPAAEITDTWVLAAHGSDSHIICVPGMTRAHIDGLVAAIATTLPRQHAEPYAGPAGSFTHQRASSETAPVR
jgi:histidine decarboxylase